MASGETVGGVPPASANTPAISGAARLVPPIWNHPVAPPWPGTGVDVKIAVPVVGSASAETSATARWLPHPAAPAAVACHEAARKRELQPLPAELQADSPPYEPSARRFRCVPPTATTFGNDAGKAGEVS